MDKIIAYKTLTDSGGIAIHEVINDIEDYVIFSHVNGDQQCKKCKAKIRYDNKGNQYFMTFGRREYLSEYLRTEA